MGIFSKKNNVADAEQFFIDSDDVAALLKSERWEFLGEQTPDSDSQKARVKQLLQDDLYFVYILLKRILPKSAEITKK